MPEFWIQLEHRPWDTCPHNIDRLTGQTIKVRETSGGSPGPDPVTVTLTSFNGGPGRTVKMFKPLRKDGKVVDALIYRRYKPPAKPDKSDAWTVPDDRKVNPWDLNEPDPAEDGTMGTIPGPVIECNVGDSVTVHFRNKDHRVDASLKPLAIEKRCHSLHPHGFVFKPVSDGAYPLSPPDSLQATAGEAALWAAVPGFAGPFKKGDRVPPDGTFTYTWDTFGWPTTAGVWLYHDHSICDMDNVELGAIGIIVIHNTADKDNEVDIRTPGNPDVLDPALLPGGSPTGSPLVTNFFPLPNPIPIMPGQLESLVEHSSIAHLHDTTAPPPAPGTPPVFLLQQDNLLFQTNPDVTNLMQLGTTRYRTPPDKLLILQLFHSVAGSGTCINGRQYLGNTPTIVSGTGTKMRFGAVGMGSEFHTFHLHGHRWVIPGPDGNTPDAIKSSAQIAPVSQFEDTRTFGPANSFVFTIDGKSGSFMRAGGPGPTDSLGEWHMHCHVLMHMMTGMMGSLLIVNGGEVFTTLPRGVPCPEDGSSSGPGLATVQIQDFQFNPSTVNIKVGDSVTWNWQADNHSTTADGGDWDSGVHNNGFSFTRMFMTAGTFPYFCSIHGAKGGVGMSGKVIVTA